MFPHVTSNIQVPFMQPQWPRARASSGGGASYFDEVLADSPLGYWRLGEASGSTLADSSGNGESMSIDLTPTYGVTGALAGDANTAMEFVGGSQGFKPGGSALTPADVTLEGWFHASGTMRFGRYNGSAGSYGIFLFTDRVYGTINNGVQREINSPAQYNDSQWHHLALTYDGTDLLLYVDGAQVASLATSGALDTGGDFFRISGGVGGTYDEVAVYDHALSAARILAHYNAAL